MYKSGESRLRVNNMASFLKLIINLVDKQTNELKMKCRNIHLNLVENIKTRILEVALIAPWLIDFSSKPVFKKTCTVSFF